MPRVDSGPGPRERWIRFRSDLPPGRCDEDLRGDDGDGEERRLPSRKSRRGTDRTSPGAEGTLITASRVAARGDVWPDPESSSPEVQGSSVATSRTRSWARPRSSRSII